MRHVFLFILLIFSGLIVSGQETTELKEGKVSYITNQNVYVRFPSTQDIVVGDTLFVMLDKKQVPLLKVVSLSSISAVCEPLAVSEIKVDTKIIAKTKKIPVQAAAATIQQPETKVIEPVMETKLADTVAKIERKQEISGRLGVSSYLNFSNSAAGSSQRMRYTFSMNAKNISNSKLSAETYISFVHKSKQWSEIKEDIFNGLKIYSLALNYKFNDNHQVWLGRKINPKISNIGAVDGVQYEAKLNAFTVGLVGGFRPDYTNYTFSTKLPQFGVFVSHDVKKKNGNMQNSLAFFEQRNGSFTDRRFTYFQHSNSLVKNLYFFGSLEADLYKKVGDTISNSPRLSNMYFLLRYRIIKPLSVSFSYSSRTNVIYYETYKDIIDRLLDDESTQGFMAQINYRPIKFMTVGLKGSYRTRKNDPKPSENAYAYVTYSRLPFINASTTISTTWMQTAYLTGNIYSINFSKDFLAGSLYGGVGYRYVDYSFYNGELQQKQHMAELSMTMRITKKLYCSMNYEGTFEKSTNLNHIYLNITQRF
jgi:hypothetical protein